MRSNIANLACFVIFATEDEDTKRTYEVKRSAQVFKKSRSHLKILSL